MQCAVCSAPFITTFVPGVQTFAVLRGLPLLKPAEQLHLDRDRKVLILHHRLRRRRMDHQAVVADRPRQIRALRVHLLADEAVFRGEQVVGERVLVKEVAELIGKVLPLVVAHLEESVFDAERVVEVLAQIVVRELRRPVL